MSVFILKKLGDLVVDIKAVDEEYVIYYDEKEAEKRGATKEIIIETVSELLSNILIELAESHKEAIEKLNKEQN